MDEREWLGQQFEAHRAHLRKVASRILGSVDGADDAIQESWLRASRAGAAGVENLGGWLTTIVARVCLDMLRARKSQREVSLETISPESVASDTDTIDLERAALVADSVGLALLVIIETLSPAERVAYVLHDVFDLSFDEIAPIIGRSVVAARQLASRARRRVQGGGAAFAADRSRQREVVEAFLAASRSGDINALIAVLDPDVVARSDGAAGSDEGPREVRGASAVAKGALAFSGRALATRLMLVNGSMGLVWFRDGQPAVVLEFAINGGKIVAIEFIASSERLRRLDLTDI